MKLRLKIFMNIFTKTKKLFDFNNHSKHSKYYVKTNTLIVGKMKDENSAVSIKSFTVGLKAKMYLDNKRQIWMLKSESYQWELLKMN